MRIYTLFTVFLISILLNGCIIDRIKQRLAVEKQLKEQKKTISKTNKNLGTEINTKKVQTYTPSKPTAPIYAKPQQVEVKIDKHKSTAKREKNKIVNTKKSKVAKKVKHKRKQIAKKIAPEPYSIKKNESDPELLGPQTTLDSNPLSENKVEKKTTKITKG